MSDQSPLTWPYVAVGAAGASIGTLLFAWRGTIRWMEPFAGVIIALCAVVLPMMAISALMALFLADEDWQPALQRAGIITGLFSIVPLLAGAAWFSASVRSYALSQLSETNQRQAASRALEDPSQKVATEACQALVRISPNLKRQQLLGTLERRKSVAVGCLSAAYQSKSATDRASSYATLLTKRWQRGAFESADSKTACQKMAYGLELPTKKSVGTPALLTCALDGPTSQLRQCCADTLTQKVGSGSKLVKSLGGSLDSEISSRLLGPFLAAALHQHQMSDKAVQIARDLGLTSPAVRRFAVRYGCSSLRAGANVDVVVRQLEAWIADDRCLGTASHLGDDNKGLKQVCRETLPMLKGSSQPAQAFCHTADRQRREAAVAAASALVEAAQVGAFHRLFSDDIRSGYAKRRSVAGMKNSLMGVMSMMRGSDGSARAFQRRAQALDETFDEKSVKAIQQQSVDRATDRLKQMEEMLGNTDISEKTKQLEERYNVDIPDQFNNMSDEQQSEYKQQIRKRRMQLEDSNDE